MSANTQNNAPVSTESVVTLNGAQLLQALDFIAPDRDTDPQQLECELTISFADGPAGGGYYCYCTDYPDEGAIMLDAETADDLLSSDSDTALTQQTLDDVKAGIPARDAEIEAPRKEIETLQSALDQPQRLIFPTMLRKMWPGSEVQAWLDDELAKLTKSSSQRAEQSVSGADGLPRAMLPARPAPEASNTFGLGLDGYTGAQMLTYGRACAEAQRKADSQVQLSGNTGQLDQFRDAAQMIEPSGNSGELDELKAFEIELRRQCFQQPTHAARDLAWCMWRAARAALAQQDADKVDAERWRAYRAAIAAEDSAFLGRGESYLSSFGLRAEVLPTEEQIDAAIDAARKEQA